MARITFVQPGGAGKMVTIKSGLSIMEGAVQSGIEGILAECGGACSCATCRIDIEPDWAQKAGTPSALEEDMLSAVQDLQPTCRLSCQIKVTDDLDGMVVHVPTSQLS